jgi:hypothetical protein
MDDLHDTVAVLGAGFSVPAGLPPANRISSDFLGVRGNKEQNVISDQLLRFWQDVFGYNQGQREPSFEDHFTLLDLAANAGHNIGHRYTPAVLRALRRLSIHRVFEILDRKYRSNDAIQHFVSCLAGNDRTAIVSLNWDIVVENTLSGLGRGFDYGIGGRFLDGDLPKPMDFSLIKLHGSANWHYCDSCHSTSFGRGQGKTTLHHRTFLEAEDFRKLTGDGALAEEIRRRNGSGIPCGCCKNPKTTARVATFSYAKAFDFFPFHASWDAALHRLRAARRWIFIGYSLPDADFAFKHLLKTAQMAGDDAHKEIHVVVKERDDSIPNRFRQFFGHDIADLAKDGLEEWVKQRIA